MWNILILLVFALLMDSIANFIRFRRPVCAVSAAVTALLLFTLSPGTPLWMELIALSAALLIGKHIWGGTGKNPINPAMIGVLLATFFFPVNFPVFEPSWLLLPAVMLSLPFLFFRPYAGVGMIFGMSAALLLLHDLTPASLTGVGTLLWGALVITDPATITSKPAAGAIAGVLAGFVPLLFSRSVFAMALGVLAANAVSFVADRKGIGAERKIRLSLKHMRIPFSFEKTAFHELAEKTVFHELADHVLETGNGAWNPLDIAKASDKALDMKACSGFSSDRINDFPCDAINDFPRDAINDSLNDKINNFSCEEILKRIEHNSVFGFGGASFPTGRKIRTVINATAAEKHLIVNGVECDPGLVHDKWLLRCKDAEIKKGIELLCRCIPFTTADIAVKDPSVVGAGFMNMDADAGILSPLRLRKVPDYYPAGAEKTLIQEVLGEKSSSTEIPAEAGILVLNVQTVFAVYEAVYLDKKADTRFITLASLDERIGSVLHVRLGADVHDTAYKVCPGFAGVYAGGGMMNAAFSSDEAVVDEKVNFLAVGKVQGYREALCSQCCLCNAVCPARLNVNRIAHFVDEGKMDQAALFHPEKCLACGSCSAVCLAGRNLAARMAKAKGYLTEKKILSL